MKSNKKEYDKKYYQENKEAKNEYMKKYRQENKEAKKEANKKYYQENKEAIKEAKKKYNQENKEAKKEAKKKYNQENKESRKKYMLKARYDITLDEYDLNLELQDNACKICKTDASEFTRKLAVDHCHATAKVRGLLCDNCNHGLGKFKDNVDLMEAAIEYLKTSSFAKINDID